MPNRIIIFTLNGCGHCSVLKGELNNESIEYTEIEVSKNKELIKEKVNKNAKAIEAKREAINAECKLSDDAWVLYNRAVEPKVSRGPSSANGARSGSKASK